MPENAIISRVLSDWAKNELFPILYKSRPNYILAKIEDEVTICHRIIA